MSLMKYGELYRNDDGNEVWRIKDKNDNVIQENIASDYDAQWLAEQI